ncbi:P27 family phage terminase small subunit [Streptomyces caatingaensis]|uniref:P27 family phage terminase small subunit n=1 Tax=Streptomyces caatingaensis TaxID=1678637 RepID=UPI001F52B121|nr:P27 family phage terminase small subunit [Streptomyces caatingaensis]
MYVACSDHAERDLSERGLTVTAERGTVKNGAATIAGRFRTQLACYIRNFGLSPGSRTAITAPEPERTTTRTCGTDRQGPSLS